MDRRSQQVEELARDIAAIELQLGIGEVRGYADALAPKLAALGYQRITPDSIVVPREPTEEMVTRALRDDRRKIAKSMKELANDLLRDKESDAIDGYNAAVILELADTIENFAPLAATSPSREERK